MGEKDKERKWREAIKSRQGRVAHEVKFVPFCVEVGGAWGSAAKTFFNTCVVLAGDDRDIDLYLDANCIALTANNSRLSLD